ncbi:MAG: hypothetical protein ACE5Z5_09570, partial [Candidatus Bathyarchaeia archaeon]
MELGKDIRGFLAEIRPIPMALNLGVVVFGASLGAGPMMNWLLTAMVFVNAFLFLYTAHLNDTMFDVMKGEYERGRVLHAVRTNDTAYLPRLGFGLEVPEAPLLPRNHYLGGIILCSVLGMLIAWWISRLVGWQYLPLALIGLGLALTYSAGLDKVPALGDTMWELGVIAALMCGYYSQRGSLDTFIFQTAMVLFIALLGVKTLDGYYDVPVDTKIDKITLPVYLHKRGLALEIIRDLAYIFVYTAFVILF